MTWAWLATKAVLRSHSSLYTEPFPPSTSPGTFQSIQTAFLCLVNEWNRLFQRLSAAQMHSRDNWAPLSRRSFDLSLKTDVALLFLFFQYALPFYGRCKRCRTFGYHNTMVSISWTPSPSFKSTGLPIKDVVMASGAHVVTLKVLVSLLFPFYAEILHGKHTVLIYPKLKHRSIKNLIVMDARIFCKQRTEEGHREKHCFVLPFFPFFLSFSLPTGSTS